MLAITLPSPILACNVTCCAPVLVPLGIFEGRHDPPSIVHRAPSPADSEVVGSTHGHKRSGSFTVVESRCSGDIWVAHGDAVGGKSTFGRALGMLSTKPKLAMVPADWQQNSPTHPPSILSRDMEDVASIMHMEDVASVMSMGAHRHEGGSPRFTNMHWSVIRLAYWPLGLINGLQSNPIVYTTSLTL